MQWNNNNKSMVPMVTSKCGCAWGSCRQAIVIIIIMREVGMHKWWVLIVKHARRSILAVALNKVVIPVVVHLIWEMDCFFSVCH